MRFNRRAHHRQRSALVALRDRSSGLTLVELLVAIAVLAFISILGWRGLDTITRSRAALNDELAQTRSLQLTFAQLEIDCANLVDANTLAGTQPLLVDANRITLARRWQPEAQAGALQLVTWRWRDGVLTREETVPTRDLNQLQRDWQTAQTGSATAIKLLSGVQQMVPRVWTDDGLGWRAWQQMSQPIVSRGSLMSPQTGTTATQTVWRGLEVSLLQPGRAASMTKIFMLGAV
ncbi:MAG: prepilin-type N-terminal cleavage/methylation domain-containing protein [Oxalobacteraceae bacterium]|nr:prepilin-type N-terminal cleavage/methylation domain-containing protein [Oxalobacteraceae bacterium]